ncbi:MAG: hypothetical protein FWC64_11885 [Treponema sp.]|nr:hypothetical protein [Treponema sp.]
MTKTTPPEKPAVPPTKERIAWHPAFYEAIQMELDEYRHALQFIPEQQLTAEPLRIDVVIIKKTADVEIKKNIASIFRSVNILEYKSPGDYVSVKDFYLVYGYACLYVALHKTDISGLSLTFVESRCPRKLISHLTRERKFTVEEKWPGIYIVSGDILPIQIIDSRELSEEENVWLKGLDNQLDARQVRRIADKVAALDKDTQMWAYLDAIARANKKALQEAYKMSDTAIASLRRTFEEIGFSAEWENRGFAAGEASGEVRGREETARNALAEGASVEFVRRITGLDMEAIQRLASAPPR